MQQHDQICLKSAFLKSNIKKGSESFWNAIKPFSTSTGIITNDSTLEENGVLKTTEVFDNYYINVVVTTFESDSLQPAILIPDVKIELQ